MPTLSTDQIHQIVERMTYMPGSRLYVGRTPKCKTGTTLVLWAQFPVRDAPEKACFVGMSDQFTNLRTPGDVHAAVLKLAMKIQFHEACEFLMADGVRVYDPHKGVGEVVMA